MNKSIRNVRYRRRKIERNRVLSAKERMQRHMAHMAAFAKDTQNIIPN